MATSGDGSRRAVKALKEGKVTETTAYTATEGEAAAEEAGWGEAVERWRQLLLLPSGPFPHRLPDRPDVPKVAYLPTPLTDGLTHDGVMPMRDTAC